MERLELIEQYRELDKQLADFTWKFNGYRKKESAVLLVPTKENEEAMLAKQQELVACAEALEAPDEVYAIWKSHFVDFAKAMKHTAEGYFKNPSGPLHNLMWKMQSLERTDSREVSVKYQDFLKLAAQIDGVMEGYFARAEELGAKAFRGISYVVTDWKENWDAIYKKMEEGISVLTDEEKETIQTECKLLYQKLGNWVEMAQKLIADSEEASEDQTDEIPDEDKTFKFEESYYRAILHDKLGVELDELLSWHEEEMNHTREEVFSIARKLDIPENDPKNMNEVNEILLKYAGPCDSPEEMFRRGREYLDRAQKAAREYVWMPSDEYCGLVGVPESLKFSYPWGGYEGGDGRRRPIYGQFFLNNYNYKAVTDGWIKMQAVHESYPGHHVQYVRRITDHLPETAEIGVKYIPMIEGMAHRSERVFEFVYPEDPFYPLFVAYRRHHTAVRIKADLMLRYYGNPIRDIVKLYMDELGFDYNTARGQIKAQENMEGYFTCYYYGMKKICDWEKQYGFDEKTYTELLFSAGNVSLENFERFLKLSEEDKKRYKTLFISKYKDATEVFH